MASGRIRSVAGGDRRGRHRGRALRGRLAQGDRARVREALPDPSRALPRARRRIANTFLDGFASLKTPRLVLLVAAGSVAHVVRDQRPDLLRDARLRARPAADSAAYVVTTAAVLGLVVPTPGGVGGYHAAVQFALTDVFAVPVATATGVALLAHAVSFVPISIIGFALFATSPLRQKGLKDLAAEPEIGSR